MNFQQRLQGAMASEGVTQTVLATRTGIDLTNICHLMHGRRAPTLKTLCKILQALPATDARWLITGGRR